MQQNTKVLLQIQNFVSFHFVPPFQTLSPQKYVAESKTRGEHFDWAHNAAEYTCKVCNNYTSNVKNTFMFHVKSAHGMTAEDYR